MAAKNSKSTESTNKQAATSLDDVSFENPEGGEDLRGVGDKHAGWFPHFVELSDTIRAEKLGKSAEGSTARMDMRGTLVTERAWGRALYFLDVTTPNGKLRVRMPEHASLYGALNNVKLGGDVRIVYAGRSEKARRGQQRAHLYDVIPGKGFGLVKAREDSLEIVKRAEDDEGAAS